MEDMKRQVEQVLIGLKKEIEPHLKDTTLITDGLLDSLDIMNLIMQLENTFDIEIDPEDVLSENFESVDSMVNLINKCKEE